MSHLVAAALSVEEAHRAHERQVASVGFDSDHPYSELKPNEKRALGALDEALEQLGFMRRSSSWRKRTR